MSGFEKHMADVLRNHEVAPPAGLDTQIFAALDGAGATAARSEMRRQLGAAGLGALLLAGLGWSISTMTPEASDVPAAAGPAAVHEEVPTPEVAAQEPAVPFEEAQAEVEPRAVEAKSVDRMHEAPMAATTTTTEPVDLTPLEQLSVQGIDADDASDKSLQEASAERDGVWRMNARVNVKED